MDTPVSSVHFMKGQLAVLTVLSVQLPLLVILSLISQHTMAGCMAILPAACWFSLHEVGYLRTHITWYLLLTATQALPRVVSLTPWQLA